MLLYRADIQHEELSIIAVYAQIPLYLSFSGTPDRHTIYNSYNGPYIQFNEVQYNVIKTLKMKKRSERRKHCTLAVVRPSQTFSPHRRPLPGDAGRPKFNQLEMVTTFTFKPNLVRIDTRDFELSW